jgi:hypothetical protein
MTELSRRLFLYLSAACLAYSGQQHEEKVNQIKKYTGSYLGAVSSRIEGMSLDFHVCKICRSTIDEVPHAPCVICNRSESNNLKVERPT